MPLAILGLVLLMTIALAFGLAAASRDSAHRRRTRRPGRGGDSPMTYDAAGGGGDAGTDCSPSDGSSSGDCGGGDGGGGSD